MGAGRAVSSSSAAEKWGPQCCAAGWPLKRCLIAFGQEITENKNDPRMFHDAAGGIEAELGRAAVDREFERRTQRIAEGQLLDHRLVLLEQGLAAALQAVGLDAGEAEDLHPRRRWSW